MKKLSVPISAGLTILSLDLLFWGFVIIRLILHPELAAEGLMAVYVFHLPSVYLFNFLPVNPNYQIPFWIQYGMVFIVGTAQYFLIGYVLGSLIEIIDRIRRRNF